MGFFKCLFLIIPTSTKNDNKRRNKSYMFNQATIDVLTQINGITNSIILKYPQTVAVSESQDMMILFDLSNLDPDEFPEIGLKDSLGEMLSLLKLFPEDREINIDGHTINVSSDTLTSSFITDNLALMDAYNKDAVQFERTEGVPSVSTFDLDEEDIKSIKSATGVFKDLTEVIFKSQDDDMLISLGATNKFNQRSNTFSVKKPSSATKEFEIKIPVENFKMLPVSNYTFDVKYNSARDSYRILLSNKSLEGFKILMTVKA